MEQKRKEWKLKDLPKKENDKFPKEGDTIRCSCGMLSEYVVLGGDDGSGFTCNPCGSGLWCCIDETLTDKYSPEYYIWEVV